jgi:hypothetical protein
MKKLASKEKKYCHVNGEKSSGCLWSCGKEANGLDFGQRRFFVASAAGRLTAEQTVFLLQPDATQLLQHP